MLEAEMLGLGDELMRYMHLSVTICKKTWV